MADLFTSISGPHSAGSSEHGRVSRAEMIRLYREHARRQLQEAEAVLNMPDDEFEVWEHRGLWVQHNRVDLLPDGSKVRRG